MRKGEDEEEERLFEFQLKRENLTRFSFSSITKIRKEKTTVREPQSHHSNQILHLSFRSLLSGPFTVFVPVDQAFEILIQKFGGMEKATEEFNKNPDVLNSVSGQIMIGQLNSTSE